MNEERTALQKSALSLGTFPALIIVDASVAFTSPNCPLGADVEAELRVVSALIGFARQQGWPIYFSTVAYEHAQQAQVFRKKIPSLDLLVAGSELVKIHPSLDVQSGDTVLVKTHASCFHDTDLARELRAKHVDSLVVCGFTTSGCVRATAVDALQNNFSTVVVSDATADRDVAAHSANLYDLQAKYTEVWTSDELYRSVSHQEDA